MPPPSRDREIFCVCRRGDDGTWMIACEKCDEWFHGHCIGLTEAEGDLAVTFFCDACVARYGVQSQWKPKCRLQTCFEPADLSSGSKYCCADHGIAFSRQCVENIVGVSSAELAFLVNASGTLDKFKALGSEMPDISVKIEPDPAKLAQIESELAKVQEAVAFLEACKDKKRQLSQEATESEGSKRDICAFNPRLSDPTNDFPELCMLDQRKCTQHKQWTVIFHERLFIKQQQAEHRLHALQSQSRGLSQINY